MLAVQQLLQPTPESYIMPTTCLVYFDMLKLCYNHSVMTGLALFQAIIMTVHTCHVMLHEWLCQSVSSFNGNGCRPMMSSQGLLVPRSFVRFIQQV